jgi:WXG100 family type VII secretion target
MAERIMMTPSELDEAAQYLLIRKTTIDEEVTALNNKIQDIASRWEGDAQVTFITQFTEDILPFLTKNLPEVIEGIRLQLTESARVLRETDTGLASALAGKA